ncbi:hypothetical protein ACFPTY_19815 [Halomonas beimenensis]|uniref:hypothetical protein n=1 Tax=Halomonas beimenensis TaxID=475662 RepID=UPI00362114DD
MQLMTAVSPQLEQLKKEAKLVVGRSASTLGTARSSWPWFRVLVSVGLASQGVTFNDSFSFHFVAVVFSSVVRCS